MPKFLTTTGVSHEIENIIKGAKSKLALVSPYLKLSQNFFERLRDADKRDVKILIVYGKEELNLDQKLQLAELQNLELYFCANLHAKCYLNESSCVITSMNMYEFSEKNNREIGVLFSRTDDQEIFNETAQEIKSIIGNSKESDLLHAEEKEVKKINRTTTLVSRPEQKTVVINPKQGPFSTKKQFTNSFFGGILNAASSLLKTDGFCLRCGTKIGHNLDKPFCLTCYQQWSIYGNPDYAEKHCHTCGKKNKTTFAKPECRNCFNG